MVNTPPTTTHHLSPATQPSDTEQWLRDHDHRGIIAAHPGTGTAPGVVFDHGPGTPVLLAMMGDTLTVKEDGSITVS